MDQAVFKGKNAMILAILKNQWKKPIFKINVLLTSTNKNVN